jgi:hypothetical protein
VRSHESETSLKQTRGRLPCCLAHDVISLVADLNRPLASPWMPNWLWKPPLWTVLRERRDASLAIFKMRLWLVVTFVTCGRLLTLNPLCALFLLAAVLPLISKARCY